MQRKYRTNLNCGNCVAAVRPHLDGEESIHSWSVDTDDPRKVLTVEGDDVSATAVRQLVSRGGFSVFEELDASMDAPAQTAAATHDHAAAATEARSRWQTYRPLLILLAYLVGIVLLAEALRPPFDSMRAMRHFMAGFFLAFSFFKMLDVKGFATAYQTYDVLARRWPAWGLAYPFLELGLGVAYLVDFAPRLTNSLTLAVMLLGLAGVTQALWRKRAIQCACLGTVFNLPMTYVTFLEDAVMGAMAAAMLIGG